MSAKAWGIFGACVLLYAIACSCDHTPPHRYYDSIEGAP